MAQLSMVMHINQLYEQHIQVIDVTHLGSFYFLTKSISISICISIVQLRFSKRRKKQQQKIDCHVIFELRVLMTYFYHIVID